MGASVEIGFIKAQSGDTARTAFERAYREACYESGSGGYTGTIAESDGFFVTRTAPMLHWQASEHADSLLDKEVTKWGSTGMVPVANATATRTVEFEVDVTALNEDWEKIDAAVKAAVKAKLRSGEQIESLRSTEGQRQYKIVSKSTTGPTTTKYVVRGGRMAGDPAYATLAEAKAAAKAHLERDRWSSDLKIVKVTVRESGEPLATVKRVPVKVTKKVTATIGKPGASVIGWATAGIYSS
jgi:hypothetical protein